MESQNPWWYGEIDKKYEEWRSSPVKWIPPIVKDFKFRPFSLNFLVGPRQVGKTTALKIFIHHFLLPKVSPKSIFYFSCEELTNFKELKEVIDNYLAFKETNKVSSSFIILDEITFVEDWYRTIKLKIDEGAFKKDVIIISGSASLELLKQKEYFPGRRGYGKDINFYPMSFSDYLTSLKNIKTERTNLEDIERAMKGNKIQISIIKRFFANYLLTGGFPLPIVEFFSTGKISFDTRKIYIDWLRNDFRKLKRNENYMKEVLAYIINARCNPVSWLSVSKETSIASPHTAKAYLEDLENLFIIKVLNLISPDLKVLYRKNKKIHFIDPFLYTTICEFVRMKLFEEAMLESVVAAHIARKYETFYWRNKKEVDIVVRLGEKQFGIEVKTAARSWLSPKHLTKTFLLTKEDIPLFLSSIDV
ncbi:MAG: ATP-binding protein [Thermoplasmatales archaeon]|nr:ATP-binding protein [Thermoplasmatales archaeon]